MKSMRGRCCRACSISSLPLTMGIAISVTATSKGVHFIFLAPATPPQTKQQSCFLRQGRNARSRPARTSGSSSMNNSLANCSVFSNNAYLLGLCAQAYSYSSQPLSVDSATHSSRSTGQIRIAFPANSVFQNDRSTA